MIKIFYFKHLLMKLFRELIRLANILLVLAKYNGKITKNWNKKNGWTTMLLVHKLLITKGLYNNTIKSMIKSVSNVMIFS